MNPARLFKNPKSETNYSWPIGHPGTIKITKHYPPPSPPRSINRAGPGDGGGLRWGWTKYIPPHPLPLPPRGEGDTGRCFGFYFSFMRKDYV